MILGHLPAGYVLAKLAYKRFERAGVTWKAFLIAALIGAIAPDLDLIYMQFDQFRPYHHHAYWSHVPIVWAGLIAMAGVWFAMTEQKKPATLMLVFAVCGFLHLCLDSIAGSIRWTFPFSSVPYSMVTVPRVTGSRRLDYLVHWSSWLELIPIAWAAIMWRRSASAA